MGILAALMAVLGVLGVVLWRVNSASRTARDLIETADEARGFFRRLQWGRKANVNPLDLVEDPREAVAAMMVAIAQSDGAITERERMAMLSAMVEKFQADGRQAEELLAHARWLVRDSREPDNSFRRLLPLLRKKLKAAERRDVVAMLTAIANVEGPPGAIESEALRLLEQRLED